ncbi:transmembrane channel-like protein [Battus philenor]|uniref:transmembrane channel-like protein n=1 Tax=Battus philenor TaxID=42288 RepID=UPI0035CF9E6F
MDAKGREKGILKLEPRTRNVIESKTELTPQGSCDRPPPSPQPSVDRLSVTWADPSSMTSSGVNLFHLPSETPVSNEVKFSSAAGDVSEDEDYSASLSAVLRQRRASVRRSRKGRSRRPSSPFLPDENRSRRRSSIFTTSSGDTAISIDETPLVTQEQIFENIHLHKEVLGSVKQQPLGMRRKLKIVHQAKGYIKRHEGQLQERLAQSKSTRDIYARFNILIATKWQHLKREAANTSNLLIPWELRIKEIESHFGSVVASYFTFLRWLFWVNLVIGFNLLVFVIIPECLTANPLEDGERKIIMKEEQRNSTNLLTVWEFEGVLKYSPIFYGYYSNVERPEYRMPLAYFLTGLVVYVYSFVAILRKMAENSRMSKLSEKEDECIFSWKLFTGWDFMIGNTETAHNRIASVILGFKEALLEEAEKKKDPRNWRIITLRALVNICVTILLGVSAYAVVTVVTRSDDNPKVRNWWRENETTTVVTVITITFPVFFELLGLLEHCHPRKQLRLQLARIMLLNLLNLYSLIFALFSKIEGMSKELDSLQPTLKMNASVISENVLDLSETLIYSSPTSCYEIAIPCLPCHLLKPSPQITQSTVTQLISSDISSSTIRPNNAKTEKSFKIMNDTKNIKPENLKRYVENNTDITINDISTENSILLINKELQRLRNISYLSNDSIEFNETSYDYDNDTEYYESTSVDSTTLTNIFSVDLLTEGSTYFGRDANDSVSITTDYTNTEKVSTYTNIYNVTDDFTDFTTGIKDDYLDLNTKKIIDKSDWGDETKTTTDINLMESSQGSFSTSEMSISSTSEKIVGTESEDEILKISEDPFTTDYRYLVNSNKNFKDAHENTVEPHITTSGTNPVENKYDTAADFPTTTTGDYYSTCPNISFNCSVNCGNQNITKVFLMTNCTVAEVKCYINQCDFKIKKEKSQYLMNKTITIDRVYFDKNNRKMYNLTKTTQKKLLKLCWETMFGQELVKLTMMDLVFVLLGTLFMDFFRALFVRYMNRCWCWDLEKKFPEYGDFKIAENILHLINNQGMVWMGMFFSPGLVVLNVFKLIIMMYLRSWAVMTCNVPHEVVFRVSKSNNFYLALLLTMLFLCVLPVGYTIVWVKPSWHCGPFSEYEKIYQILTNNIYKILPKSLNFALEYIASPAIVIPLLVLLILIIYYLTSLTNSLREANNDLKIQLRRERTEERRKMFQLADTRRRTGSSVIDNTPFSRWKKALPSLPVSKSIESDDRKTVDETKEHKIERKGKGGIFAKIVGLALDKKPETNPIKSEDNHEDDTDTNFHETLPKEILKIKNISVSKNSDIRKRPTVEFKPDDNELIKHRIEQTCLKVKIDKVGERTEKKAVLEKLKEDKIVEEDITSLPSKASNKDPENNKDINDKKINRKQTSESSTYSRQSDSISSVIPVITISTTESDDEIVHIPKAIEVQKHETAKRSSPGLKSLRRQSSVDSINDNKPHKEKKSDDGHKYQYSL